MDPARQDLSGFGRIYSEASFQAKLKRVAGKVGGELLHKAHLLYQVLKDQATPMATKAKILGALGYFIAPVDVIPDFIPVAGFADDLAVLVYVLKQVAAQTTEAHRAAATAAVRRLMPDFRRASDDPTE
jgi:uncharacterized membrane protein YkvA (DUF1232 family)